MYNMYNVWITIGRGGGSAGQRPLAGSGAADPEIQPPRTSLQRSPHRPPGGDVPTISWYKYRACGSSGSHQWCHQIFSKGVCTTITGYLCEHDIYVFTYVRNCTNIIRIIDIHGKDSHTPM